ncbi:DUF1993 domain-containing protein [Motiliproteus sp. MSK22-1]|uniref:DUF1993 domain-containing protein n=1 Tax=Motiliproteus sp. MSK22-1 TaxID=1897630 RepID=UPI00097696DB|nr:DUF1993 domain-containing protein [Motiliproteus sp. MSK22-1]OMH38875.1 hypothetical protein BGP75_00415 [Motiliproteus sp. MSK22-1]
MIPTKVFIHYLNRLKRMLRKMEHSQVENHDLLHARLAEDMFPLVQQAKVAIGFSLRASCPLAGLEIVSFEDKEDSVTSLIKQISLTVDYLSKIPSESFNHMGDRIIQTKAGFAEHELDGDTYFLTYALPNFFFHLNMVYAILRNQGVALSKSDFDDFHQYPDDFSF